MHDGLPLHNRLEQVGFALGGMSDVPFFFQPSQQGLHGGIGDVSIGGQLATYSLDGGRIQIPNDRKDFHFRGTGWGLVLG